MAVRHKRTERIGTPNLAETLNEMLDAPKTEPREVVLEIAPFEPRQVIEDVAAMLAAKAQGKGLFRASKRRVEPGTPSCQRRDRLQHTYFLLAGSLSRRLAQDPQSLAAASLPCE